VSASHVAVALLVGAQLHAHHVGAGIGLAHGQGADVLARDQLGQVLGFLRGVAVAVDLVDAQVAVRAVRQAHRGRSARDLFQRHDVRQVAHVGAAVFLAHGHAVHAQIAQLAPQVGRELVDAVDLRCTGGDFLGREGLDAVTQGGDVFAEAEVESGNVHHERSPCTDFQRSQSSDSLGANLVANCANHCNT
jgi:hypothetical protein